MPKAPASTQRSQTPVTLAEAATLAALAAIPGYVNLLSARIFEEEKALLLQAAGLLVLAGMAWTGRSWREWRSRPAVIVFVLLLVALAISTGLALVPREAFAGAYVRRHGLLTWLALGVIFLEACLVAQTVEGRRRLMVALAVGSLVPSAYALIQAVGLDPVSWTDAVGGRAGSTLGNPLLTAGYLVVVIPLVAALSVDSPRFLWLLGLQVCALLATGSRGPILALGMGLGAMALAAWWETRHRRLTTAVAGLLLALAILLIAAPALQPTALARFVDVNAGSGRVRVLIWQTVRAATTDGGWRLAVGWGPESLHRIAPRHYVPEIGRIEGTEAMPDRAHNEVLDMLVTSGVTGVLLELAFMVAVVIAAGRTSDRWMRAGLVGAAIAHVVELQFGIATVSSRLAFLAIAAIALGSPAGAAVRQHAGAARLRRPALAGMVTLGLFGLVVTTTLPVLWSGSAGDAAALRSYLWRLSLVSPALTGTFVAGTLMLWRSLDPSPAPKGVAWMARLVVALVLMWPLVVTPSRADVITKAGLAFEQRGRITEAGIAHDEAARLVAWRGEMATNVGRVQMLEAARLEGTAQAAAFAAAGEALARAEALSPADPYAARNLASLERVRARTAPQAGEAALAEADRHYRHATELAPGMPALWVEWANVDVERRQLEAARVKLRTARQLDGERYDLWLLTGIVGAIDRQPADAVEAFSRALVIRPGDVPALRGRAAALAQLGRLAEARSDAEAILRVSPGDSLARRLVAPLPSPER